MSERMRDKTPALERLKSVVEETVSFAEKVQGYSKSKKVCEKHKRWLGAEVLPRAPKEHQPNTKPTWACGGRLRHWKGDSTRT